MLRILDCELEYMEKIIKGAKDRFFFNLEIEIAARVWDKWKRQTRGLYKELRQMDTTDEKTILEFCNYKMSVEFPMEAIPAIAGLLKDAYKTQKKRINVNAVFGEKDYESIQFLENYQNFWIKNYYDKHVGEEITKIVRSGLNNFKATADIADDLKKLLEGKYDAPVDAEDYWVGLAGNTVNRARQSGNITGMAEAGTKWCEIVANEDERTCPICRSLNGRVFEVREAVKFNNTFLSLKSPEEVKERLPWVKNVNQVSKTTDRLLLSHKVAPFHFRCRCTIVDKYESFEEDVESLLYNSEFQSSFAKRISLDHKAKPWIPKDREEAYSMMKIGRKDTVENDFIKKLKTKNIYYAEAKNITKRKGYGAVVNNIPEFHFKSKDSILRVATSGEIIDEVEKIDGELLYSYKF